MNRYIRNNSSNMSVKRGSGRWRWNQDNPSSQNPSLDASDASNRSALCIGDRAALNALVCRALQNPPVGTVGRVGRNSGRGGVSYAVASSVLVLNDGDLAAARRQDLAWGLFGELHLVNRSPGAPPIQTRFAAIRPSLILVGLVWNSVETNAVRNLERRGFFYILLTRNRPLFMEKIVY